MLLDGVPGWTEALIPDPRSYDTRMKPNMHMLSSIHTQQSVSWFLWFPQCRTLGPTAPREFLCEVCPSHSSDVNRSGL